MGTHAVDVETLNIGFLIARLIIVLALGVIGALVNLAVRRRTTTTAGT